MQWLSPMHTFLFSLGHIGSTVLGHDRVFKLGNDYNSRLMATLVS
jgi:hypothetical protein